jgi:NADH dehydrogenase FAD-containing subunit
MTTGCLETSATCILQVNDKLQVAGHSTMYAIGDATDIKETKVGLRLCWNAR